MFTQVWRYIIHFTINTKDLIIQHEKFRIYRQTSNIRRTEFQNLNVYRFVLQLSLPNPLQPGVESRMKM